MKDRRLKMILIPLVVAIWSYAVYKYVFWSDEAASASDAPHTQAQTQTPHPQTDSAFTLIANYRDPFLDRPARHVQPSALGAQTQTQTPVLLAPPKPPITIPAIDWSIARYNGLVQRTSATERDGLLSITGRVYHVAQGDIVKGIEVLALFPDSIQLRFEEETKTITKR